VFIECFISQLQARYQQIGTYVVSGDLPGKEIIKAIGAAEKQIPVMIFPDGAIAEFIALQAICFLVMRYFQIAGLYFSQSLIGAYPYLSAIVFRDGMNGVIRQAVSGGQFPEPRLFFSDTLRFQLIKPIAGTNPYPVPGIFIKR